MATQDFSPGVYANGPEESARLSKSHQVTVDGTNDISEAWDIRRFTMGAVRINVDPTATAFTFTASESKTGTYYAVHDEDGVAVSLTLHATTPEGKWYTIPARVMEHSFIKFAGDAGGTDVVCTVVGKS